MLETVSIRGVVGEPVKAKLVSLNVKPWPGVTQENIAPYISVTFATCALSTDVDVILCESVVNQLDEFNAYNIVKPTTVEEAMVDVMIPSEDISDLQVAQDDSELFPVTAEVSAASNGDDDC